MIYSNVKVNDTLSTHYRLNNCTLSTHLSIVTLSTHYRKTIATLSPHYRYTTGKLSAHYRQTIVTLLLHYRHTIDTLSTHYRHTIDNYIITLYHHHEHHYHALSLIYQPINVAEHYLTRAHQKRSPNSLVYLAFVSYDDIVQISLCLFRKGYKEVLSTL